ncbi:E3 SUMO-protein ligase NSE2 isoform X2 [Desmodus rotundus]|uniref:E3 SUMO-protein ligase NSE2 isoform X2 n=1 Tax=Desmodus rotundus TaxID=9430 RepID=UPI0023816C34|nr:E3 SUMO-protein ligase NSE2 isoform X2 [Desmodus rotundus]
MPGRSSSNSGSTGFISFSGIESALSSLKNFQNCINTGMDTASSVALDLVETQTEVSGEYSMDKAMVEFAMMDRELNHYVKAVQSTINHVKEERPENIPDLKLLVEKKFLALQNKNSDADFQNNEKFVQFKQQLKELKKQSGKPTEDGGRSEFDRIKDKEASRAGNERDRGSALLELPASPWGCFEQDHRRPSQQSVGELPREYKDFGLRTSLLSYQTSIEHFGGFA